MAFPDPRYYYRLLVPGVAGTDHAADVVPGGLNDDRPVMAPIGGYTSQLWRFAPTGDGAFRLSTLARGPAFCAEPEAPGPAPIRLRRGAGERQGWVVEPIEGPRSFAVLSSAPAPFVRTGWVRMTTRLSGPGWSLDLALGGDAFVPTLAERCDRPGQAWLLSRTDARTT